MEILISIAMWSGKIVGWLIFSYIFVSFFEYQIHRHLMHRMRLPKWIYRASPYILETFEAHAVRHHRTWYKEFDHEPDPVGREENLDIKIGETVAILTCLLPIFGLLFWLSPLGGSIVLAVSIIHNRAWNVLHRQMHMPQSVFFQRWPMFCYLARHHYMHHQQTRTNYNVVFPLFDYLMNSVAKPKLGDIKEMLRLGYLQGRTPASCERIARWRVQIAEHRSAA
jgi:hypothetical protein